MNTTKTRADWKKRTIGAIVLTTAGALSIWACEGERGEPGAVGPMGTPGATGPAGPQGAPGAAGPTGEPGPAGPSGSVGDGGADGPSSDGGTTTVPTASTGDGVVLGPLPALVAARFVGDPDVPAATDVKSLIKARVEQIANNALPVGVEFPLRLAATDTVRVIRGLKTNVVIKWMDPLTFATGPTAPRFGANPDYVSFIGDGWGTFPAASALWGGSGSSGWIWVNHEYVSSEPSSTSAPVGQALQLAALLKSQGLILGSITSPVWSTRDLDAYIVGYKRQIGGSWTRIAQDTSTGEWVVDLGAANQRFDSSSNTLFRMTGYGLSRAQKDDAGLQLLPQLVPGTAGNCSGGTTPWGTIVTAEENVQDYYGDMESCWDGTQHFVANMGCNPGAPVALDVEPKKPAGLGFYSSSATNHTKDTLGWLTEIDVGQAPGKFESNGVGHKKLGALGKARWENLTFVTDANWKLRDGKPIVTYSGDDRRGGRIYKFVSKNPWTATMTKAQTRALLDEGSIWVAHFADLDNASGLKVIPSGGGASVDPTETAPGQGVWYRLAIDNTTQDAPNAAAVMAAGTKIGDALKNNTYNGIGGFTTDDAVRGALFTASAKVGIRELNRPEDVEWNPKDKSGKSRLYIAFTNHNSGVQLDQAGKLVPATDALRRTDTVGALFALEEADPANPEASATFAYFKVWGGTTSTTDVYSAANIDNLVVDKDGDVWFGTDGNFGTQRNATGGRAFSDAYYFLDLDPAHKTTPTATYGKPFRFLAVPSDAEATGPAFTPDLKTFFAAVQHPGESFASTWPQHP